MTVNSPSGSTLQCHTWIWNDMSLNSLNSPSGSTLQCGRWLWDDIPWNSPKCPQFWNSTSGFDFDYITAVDMSFCTSLHDFIQIGPQKKMTSYRFTRWRISAILDFRGQVMGSLKKPCTTSYTASIDTIALNCLVFEKSRFCILATEKTNEQMNRPVA